MISARINADEETHSFLRDERTGFHLVFASREAMKQSTFTPHWVGTCGDAESLEAMCRWTGVRRDRWQQWGELAESIGQEAFARHMDDLLEADPLARVEGVLLQRQEDPARIGIGEVVQGQEGLRFELLHVHALQSADACEALLDWFNRDGNHGLIAGLVDIAYSAGTDELDRTLDEIASLPPKPKRAPRGRRRGGGGRRQPLAA